MNYTARIDAALSSNDYDTASNIMAYLSNELAFRSQAMRHPIAVLDKVYHAELAETRYGYLEDQEFSAKLKLAVSLANGLEAAQRRLGLEE